jgi:uncharacterized protein (DUF488 family)
VKQGLLILTNDQYQRPDERPFIANVRRQNELDAVLNQFKDWTATDLMRFVYRKYPFYALNSTRVEELLSPSELQNVRSCRPSDENPVIFTIGYEGKSLETFLLKLYQNNVHLLVDVRASSYSMKKEFIGSRLASGCKLLQIDYKHIPEVGIPNTYRKEIADKSELFQVYKHTLLPQKAIQIRQIADMVKKEKRIALTCFEAHHTDCHRHYLVEELSRYLNERIPVEHL